MTTVNRRLIYCSVAYLMVVLAFAVLFAANFTSHVHDEAEVFFPSLYFLVAVTYAFYFTLFFSIFKRGLVLFIFLPLIVAIISFFIGLVIIAIFSGGGTPVQIIYIYSITYSYLAVGALVYWLYLRGELLG